MKTTARQGTRGEFIVPKIRLQKIDSIFYVRTKRPQTSARKIQLLNNDYWVKRV